MLTGVTVVDFSRHLPGPICTMRLADLGAEVMEITSFPVTDHGVPAFMPPAGKSGRREHFTCVHIAIIKAFR
ncbi:CoA transferase [Brevibacillus choshinensis]|uniref:CoA transferase n=1 Tax=Brevibacillus choshinensis TaxID=54911 RepID=UPI0023B0C758|nr:CoA transferase [Brevibacillus choshinensis]